MSNIRLHIALRALPIFAGAGDVAARGGLDCLDMYYSHSLPPRNNTASHRHHIGGIAAQH